ncbi:hypothetical protein [Actinophytocola sp.]|uniref:hypothetical protein n=1 Tax=Actinophytocola sp. TaxID=1872138 RepID=UPI00389A0F43
MSRLLVAVLAGALLLVAGCGPEQSGPDLSGFAAVHPPAAVSPVGPPATGR